MLNGHPANGAPTLKGMHRRLGGWGRFPVIDSETYRPERLADLTGLVALDKPLLARGLGRAYGDAALNGTGATILIERLNRLLHFDPVSGILGCEAGVSLQRLLEVFVGEGFLPPVCPGTQFVTVGGAVAFDVHGKNHHRDGSLGRHVLELRILGADGRIVRCSREHNSDLFAATIGGMGLTGVILEVRLRLRRMESPYIGVDYDRARDLDDALRLFDDSDDQYAYSVGWIDCLAGGKALGRSVLMRGNELPASAAPEPPHRQRRILNVPFDLPGAALNPLTIRAFNAAYYHRHPAEARNVPRHFSSFFFPLDGIRNWNRIYGRHGFLQYQCILPGKRGREGLVQILERARAGRGSFLAVLKRFGDMQPDGILSFPSPGYTLALDFPAERSGLMPLLRELDAIVIEHGGRVYLAKDARLDADAFGAMYPDLPRWLAVKRRIDPETRFQSNLGRRLGLHS